MKLPALVRPRRVWVPTAFGGLVLLITVGAAVLAGGARIHPFLAIEEPVGARILVVEGWLPQSELDQAVRAYVGGRYEVVLTTGGPMQREFDRLDSSATYAERARRYLVWRGLSVDAVIAVPAPASARERSFQNAVMVRGWIARSGVEVRSVDVFSSGVHGRRSRALHRLALGPQVRVGILTSTPDEYDPNAWWRTSAGTKDVLTEAIAWLWTALFFHPEPAEPP